MRIHSGGVLMCSLLVAACGSDSTSVTEFPGAGLHGGDAVIAGQVHGLVFGPDSTSALVPSRVVAVFVGTIPPDTTAFAPDLARAPGGA